jgi:tetratricopeptide (TPR) repeat protein
MVMVGQAAYAQTYHVGDSSSEKQQTDEPANSTQKPLGWGSNIQNARLARAAEMALKSGNYTAAVDYAQRAAQAAPGDAQLWFLLGYAARLAGKTTLSVDAYSHGLKIEPASLDGLSGLAQTYSRIGKRDEAEALLTRVVAMAPKRTEDSALLGELLLRSELYDQAVTILQRTEQVQPSARVELLLALCYDRLKQPEKADHELDLAKRKAPNDPEVERALAGFYREQGNYSGAIEALRAIPHKSPDLTAELAYTYQLDGNKDEAARLYSQAATAAPHDTALQLSAAQAKVSIEDLEGAEPFLKRAAASDPESYRLHAIRGQIAALKDDDPQAVREYSTALDRLPQSPPEGPLYGIELRMTLVDLLHGQQDQAAAQRQLEIAHSEIAAMDERGPDRIEFLRLRARINMNLGDFSGAQSDVTEALAINGKDPATLQLNGDVLMKSGHPQEAEAAYRQVLAIDSNNRLALTSLGYVAREAGHDEEAEQYFRRLAAVDPKSFLPYLALGDMYTARRDFSKAETYYRKGYELAPHNSLIVAGGMNAAIEAHHLPLAAEWLARSNDEMQQEPHLMREKERYLSWGGHYQESADVGEQAIKKLPKDRDVVVYLGYDLLHMERYDDLLKLTSQYRELLPKEPDIPLLAGYVHKHAGQLPEAQEDFAQAIKLDPNITTAYVNRGFVENDLHQSAEAAADFRSALHLEPNNGEAHLGLAFSSLGLHQPRLALRQAQLAEAQLGESLSLHLIRATAYSATGAWTRAVTEYQAALKYTPNDPGLHRAYAGTLYDLRRYRDAISELQTAEKLSPGDSVTYAQLARSYAQLRDEEQTLHYVQLAEQRAQADPATESEVLVSDGEALTLLGQQNEAMDRFTKALGENAGDRFQVRLAVAHLMAGRGEQDGARRQVALALMEAQAGETPPPSGTEIMQVADVFLALHEFQLAQRYFQSALAAGAPESAVRIGLANSYLAEGDTARAQGQLSLISTNAAGSADSDPSYQYMLAKASVLRQEHQNVRALTAFAQAADAAGDDETANQELLQAGRDEGLRINRNLSFLSTFSVMPIFEDTTVYPLDAKLDVINPVAGRQGLLPLPRSSVETQWTGAYHLHFGNVPDVTGFFQMRNAQGEISLPSANSIVSRDTTDYSFNVGINPTVHLGTNVLTFNGGIQETVRRDSKDPVDMNQNLFRQFVYMSTSSFFNVLSVSGYATRESGPFTLSGLRSRDLTGALDFRVGTPWGKTALVTGMGARDEQFFPVIREFFFTSSYVGVERLFGEHLRIRGVAEDLRSWRVEFNRYAPAQALRPAASVEFLPSRNWSVQGSFAYSRNMGFHAYDAVQTGFSVSYGRAISRTYNQDGSEVKLRYPIRFTAGMQQEDFFNFTGGNNSQLRPYISISLF